ncbi:M23 family metallopeptidase [Leucobacter sp. 1207-22]|uniref:M23 family metallopeptidase n=1 Tax=Leucobacter sp. 1207-22 TaxID=2604456 RepID=UPI004063F82E
MTAVFSSLYRIRSVIFAGATAALVFIAFFARYFPSQVAQQLTIALAVVGFAGWILALVLLMAGARLRPAHDTRVVQSPVRGRWLALNSPASRTPSHGTRAYGQSDAVDLVFEPAGWERPAFGSWPGMREPEDFRAFGAPVHAMISGTVVRASDWRRDHKSRGSSIAFMYLMAEGTVRELGGPGFVVGNHVVIRGDDGVYAAIAHLKRGSLVVRKGDRVTAGDHIASCGNSGNSSEPHVHAQLMDRGSFWTGQGIPMLFSSISIDDSSTLESGMPKNSQHLICADDDAASNDLAEAGPTGGDPQPAT